MINIIKQELDDYLEFDSNDLFKHTDLIRVFGGAIRDIIAEQPIHDVDILVGSRSLNILETLLEIQGSLQVVDITDLWNSDIDKRIEQERKLFENRVKHLNTLKIS